MLFRKQGSGAQLLVTETRYRGAGQETARSVPGCRAGNTGAQGRFHRERRQVSPHSTTGAQGRSTGDEGRNAGTEGRVLPGTRAGKYRGAGQRVTGAQGRKSAEFVSDFRGLRDGKY